MPDQEQPQKQPDSHKALIAFMIAVGVIFALLLYIIFNKPEPEPVNDNSKRTRDSVLLLTSQIEEQKKITDHYLGVVDSMKALPPRIKIIYRDQKNSTFTASAHQSDSAIRVNSGLKATRLSKVL
jgi:hypothetical protein